MSLCKYSVSVGICSWITAFRCRSRLLNVTVAQNMWQLHYIHCVLLLLPFDEYSHHLQWLVVRKHGLHICLAVLLIHAWSRISESSSGKRICCFDWNAYHNCEINSMKKIIFLWRKKKSNSKLLKSINFRWKSILAKEKIKSIPSEYTNLSCNSNWFSVSGFSILFFFSGSQYRKQAAAVFVCTFSDSYIFHTMA